MASEDEYRERAEALLQLAANSDNMKERGRYIDEAMRWHNMALRAHEDTAERANDNEAEGDEAW